MNLLKSNKTTIELIIGDAETGIELASKEIRSKDETHARLFSLLFSCESLYFFNRKVHYGITLCQMTLFTMGMHV